MAVNRIAALLKEYETMLHEHKGSIRRYDLTITEMKEIKNRAVAETIAKGTPSEGCPQNAILGSSFFSAVSIAFRAGFALGHRAAIAEQREKLKAAC